METPASSTRLLTRHFVRRFVDNDLLSAHVDRHESLGFFAAALVSGGVFLSILLIVKYLISPVAPGWVALMAMEEKFTLIAGGMIVTALATAAQWDALAVDARDAAILSPLPVPRHVIVRARATANAIFAGALVLALTVGPAVMYSLGSVTRLHVGPVGVMRVMASHLLAASAAALFAFLAVVASRELARLLLGARLFTRISTLLQVVLVVLLSAALLLVAGSSAGVSRRWLAPEGIRTGVTPFAVPAVWFLGLSETMNGDTIVLAPLPAPAGWIVRDDDFTRRYRSYQPLFRQLATMSVAALAIVFLLASAAYAWNSRRLPEPMARPRKRRRVLDRLTRVATATVARDPATRAGFFFTIAVLFRSTPHRLALAVAVAVGLALTIATFGGAGLDQPANASTAPLSIWALQTAVIVVLVSGFRHAVAIPAELRANWIFHYCWAGRLREYLAGVQRAAIAAIAVPALTVLLPFHLYLFGPTMGALHAVNGVALAALLVRAALHGVTRPPFVSSYVPQGTVRSLGPIYLMIAAAFSFSFAALERVAARSATGAAVLAMGLTVLAIMSTMAVRRPGRAAAMVLDEVPEPVCQSLGLSE